MDDNTDADLLLAAVRSEIAKIHTAIPGTILGYDHATQKATVQIAVKSKVLDGRTGAITNVAIEPIPNVPVCFSSGGGGTYNDTFPLVPGDTVLLLVAERSLDEFKSTGAASCDAQDVRRFDYADAIAIPFDTSFARPVGATGRSATARVIEAPMVLVGSSTATDFVALASLVSAQLNTLKAAISAAPIVAGDGGASFKASLIAALAAWPGTIAATRLKAL